ncbi:Delta(24)-sterol C-methyltransferase, partial [Nowakowskiella sp. JEL0078]
MPVIEENELSQFTSNLEVDPELENFFIRLQKKTANKKSSEKAATDYVNYWNDRNKLEGNEAAVAEREKNTQNLTNLYYDLATDFYEWGLLIGWGESFHFGRMFKGDALKTSLSRHEDYLALKLGLKPGQECVDVGCGIGGPLREIARFTGANVTGLNNNAYQVGRARRINKRENLDGL